MISGFPVRIAGTGRYIPEKVMTNFDFEKILDTSDEWIVTRTGIRKRHFAAEDEKCSVDSDAHRHQKAPLRRRG